MSGTRFERRGSPLLRPHLINVLGRPAARLGGTVATGVATPAVAVEQDPCIEAGGYPWVDGACLHANDLNQALQGNPGASPPTNTGGGQAGAFKQWWSTLDADFPAQQWFDGSQWVASAWLDPAAHLFLPLIGGGQATLAAAALTDLGSVPQSFIEITGAGPITGFGTGLQQGSAKLLIFAGNCQIVFSPSEMWIAGGASVTASPNDLGIAIAGTGGKWFLTLFPGYLNVTANVVVGTTLHITAPGTYVMKPSGAPAPMSVALAQGLHGLVTIKDGTGGLSIDNPITATVDGGGQIDGGPSSAMYVPYQWLTLAPGESASQYYQVG